MPRHTRSFRLNARNIFLTYPRCSLDKATALELIKNISCASDKKYVRVAREVHADGEPHLHVLIQFEGRFQIYNPRHFDLTHPSSTTQFHPNIQGAKSSVDVQKYIEKGGDYADWGEFRKDARNYKGIKYSNKPYADALNTGNIQMALDTIRAVAPRDFVMQYHNISNNLTKIFETPIADYESTWERSSFTISQTIQKWINDTFLENEISPAGPNLTNTVRLKLNRSVRRPMSLILEGPSRTGKTEWARSLGKHNYISGHLDFNSKTFKNDVEYNVIDDISPKYLSMKHWKELIGAQHDWQSNCKYSKPVLIKGGIPSVILCNPGEASSYAAFLCKPCNQSLQEWTQQNAIFEFLDTPMFHTEVPDSQQQTV